MYQKSKTCKGKISGKYINEYLHEQEAQNHADYLQNNAVPYQCKVCKMWHLSPPKEGHTGNRITSNINNITCSCKDSWGRKKTLYATESEASEQATIIGQTKGIVLSIYRCKKSRGWHLTKR